MRVREGNIKLILLSELNQSGMAKRILGVIIGLVVGMGIIMMVETLSGKMYPPPPGIDFTKPEAIKAMMQNMPVSAFLMILLAYAAGSFAGGLVASLIAGIQQPKAAVIVGSILLVAG